jgi:hypothetical protein
MLCNVVWDEGTSILDELTAYIIRAKESKLHEARGIGG